MTVLFTDSAGTLNQQTPGNSVTYSYVSPGRVDTVNLLTSSGTNWTPTSGYIVYNVVRAETPVRPEFASGSRDPIIVVIEKSQNSSDDNLFVWAFDEAGLSAKANSSVPLTTTPVGLLNVESKYLIDLNKNQIVSDYGKYPTFVELDEFRTGMHFDLGYSENKYLTGLNENDVPLKTSSGGAWSASASGTNYIIHGAIVSNDYHYSYNDNQNQFVLSGSASLTIGVLSDPDGLGSGTPTTLNNFVLNDAGTEFIESTASLTDIAISTSGGIFSQFPTATNSDLVSFNFLEAKLNKDLDGSGYIGVGTPGSVGTNWSAIETNKVTASEVVYNNGRFFSEDEHILIGSSEHVSPNNGTPISGYTFLDTNDLRLGTVTLTPQVLFEESFSAGGWNGISMGTSEYVFVGNHNGKIYASFSASTTTNYSAHHTAVLEIFDSPYYFSSKTVDVFGVSQLTAVPVFRFVEAIGITATNTPILETTFGRDVDGDGIVSSINASTVVTASTYIKTISHSSGETTITTNSPTISRDSNGTVFWFQSAESALNVLPGIDFDLDQYHQLLASAGNSSSGGSLKQFSAPSTYVLTGAYVEDNAPVDISSQPIISTGRYQEPIFKLVYDTQSSNSFGSVFSVYSFVEYSALDAFAVWNSASSTYSISDLHSLEVNLKYDITGDAEVGTDGLNITKVIVAGGMSISASDTKSPSLVKVASGSHVVDKGLTPKIDSLAAGKLLVTSSGDAWSATTSSIPIGIYETTTNSSSIETFVLTQMSGTTSSPTFSTWTFSAQTSSLSLQTNQATATSIDLIDLLAIENGLNFDITGDGLVGDKITNVYVQTSSYKVDSNNDGVLDDKVQTPAVIKSSLDLYGFDYTDSVSGSKVGEVNPFVMLKTSTGASWTQSRNMEITGAHEAQLSAAMSQITLVEKGGTAISPIYQKWIFNHQKDLNIATATNSLPTALTVSELIGEEQSKNIDLNGDGTIGDQVLERIFSSTTEPSLVKVQSGNYALDFPAGTNGVSSGLQVLLTASGLQWQPSRNIEISGVFSEQTSSSQQTITVVEKSGSNLSPIYNNWKFTLDNEAFFSTATSVVSIPVSSAFLGAAENRNQIDLMSDGVIGDRITNVVTKGGRFNFDSDNDGFADQIAIAPAVIRTQSGSYGLDVTGEGTTGQTTSTLFLEAISGTTNWIYTSGAEIIGGYVSYDVNSLGQQETRGHIYEKSGTDLSPIYSQWTFLQASSTGVAAATSTVAQTVALTDILSNEITLGFDLTNDGVVGDRLVEIALQIPDAPRLGAPSLVKAASGAYGVDSSGNASIGDLKQVMNLKTKTGDDWVISSGASVIGVYSIEEFDSSGQLDHISVVVEKSGSETNPVYQEWIFPDVTGQTYLQATASIAQTADFTDVLAREAAVGFDLTSDGLVGDRITGIIWKAEIPFGLNPGPTLANVISGAYGVDYDGVAVTGSLTALVNLETLSKTNWAPSLNSEITGVYTESTNVGNNVTTQTFVIEKSGTITFPVFSKWTFTEDTASKIGVATTTTPVTVTESDLLNQEIAVGYDLNGDSLIGDGISSVLVPSQKYINQQTESETDSPSVVRLASGEFGLVTSGNNYISGDPSSFSLRESIASGGLQWTPNTGYYLSGVYKTDTGYTLFEQQDIAGGTHKYKQTDFILSSGVNDKYYVNIIDGLDRASDVVSNAELISGYDLDLNNILGSGAETITIQSYEYQDKFSNTLKSPSLVKLADGSLSVDFTGNLQLSETPEMLLQTANLQPYTFTSDQTEAKGIFTTNVFNTTTQKYDFIVNVIDDRGLNDNNSYFLNQFTIQNDTLAIDISGESGTDSSTIRSKEEVLGYDLDEDSKVGFLNKDLLVPAFIVQPGPDDFDLVKTETNALGIQSKMWLISGSDQLFFTLHSTDGSLWNPLNQRMKGFYVETRKATEATTDEGEEAVATSTGIDTKVVGITTAPSSVTTPSSFSLWEFTISGDVVTNELDLVEFTLSTDTAETISYDALSVLEAEKGFDLTGDRQVLGATSTTTFKTKIEENAETLSKVNAKLSELPLDPIISESTSKLIQSDVSLITDVLAYGDSTINRNVLNTFLSNGSIPIELDDNVSGQEAASTIEIDASLELSVYNLDDPVENFDDFVEILAGSIGKTRTGSAAEALTDFTNALSSQSILSTDGEIYLPKMKTFDFTGNIPSDVDNDEIKIQLAEDSGFVLLGDESQDSDGYYVNFDNVSSASSTEILLLGDFTLRGGEGDQVMVGDDGIQDVMLGNGDDVIYAGGGNDIISSASGENYFDGGEGDDKITGGSGGDTFVGGYGNDQLDGGDGTDTAKYVGSYFDFTVVKQLGAYLIEDNLGIEGSDTVMDVERVEFVDGTLAFDTDGNAGQTYRLYQAAFERIPDSSGVNYHVNDIEGNGLVLHQIAGNFLASPEFEQTYGENLSDSSYVDALYENVLGRAPADSEKQYYLERFTKPASDSMWMDHAAALIGFSESPENITLVAPQIENGIWLGS